MEGSEVDKGAAGGKWAVAGVDETETAGVAVGVAGAGTVAVVAEAVASTTKTPQSNTSLHTHLYLHLIVLKELLSWEIIIWRLRSCRSRLLVGES